MTVTQGGFPNMEDGNERSETLFGERKVPKRTFAKRTTANKHPE